MLTITLAIILFSGLGDIKTAQETLSVGVGALAGSTIMLLTVPFAISVIAGRVDINDQGHAHYRGKPKLTTKHSLSDEFNHSGVALTQAVKHGGVIMGITTIPYFLIQIPASFLHGPKQEMAKGEHWWSLAAMIICLIGLIAYMRLQLQISKEGQDKGKRVAVMKKLLTKGKVSLSGALKADVRHQMSELEEKAATEYQALKGSNTGDQKKSDFYPPPSIAAYLAEVLRDAFNSYDEDGNVRRRKGFLDYGGIRVFFISLIIFLLLLTNKHFKHKMLLLLFSPFDLTHRAR